jgi:hypothetical protein
MSSSRWMPTVPIIALLLLLCVKTGGAAVPFVVRTNDMNILAAETEKPGGHLQQMRQWVL